MPFDKDYPNRKDKRRRYYGSKSCDASCRPGGSCLYCRDNRLKKKETKDKNAKKDIEDFKKDD